MIPSPIRRPALALLGAAMVGCGGGSGGGGPTTFDDPPPAVDDATAEVAAQPACDAPFYRDLVGFWEGTIDYDRTDDAGSACTWTVELEVRDESPIIGICRLDAVSTSTVEHTAVADPEVPGSNAAQCLDGTSRFDLLPPFIRSNVEEGEDFDYPVRVGWDNGFEPSSGSGPYFGDENVTVPYIALFDGSTSATSEERWLEVSPDRIEYVRQLRQGGGVIMRGVLTRPGEAPR